MITIIADVETIIENYRDSMMEYINAHLEDVEVAEYADDLATLAKVLQRMTSKDPMTQLTAIRQEARDGYTMMMLPEQFIELETVSRNDQDFRVVMFRADGTPVGILHESDLNW